MRLKACLSIVREDETIDLVVRGEWTRGHEGRRWGDPGDWSPPEPDESEILSVHLDAPGEPTWSGDLTDDEEEAAREALALAVEDDEPDPPSQRDWW